MAETTRLRLLVDALNLSSPGGSKLQSEMARAIAASRPTEAEVVFATASPDDLPGVEGILPVVRPRPGGWLAFRRWFHRELPVLARKVGADVVYAPGGILSKPVCREFGAVNGINNMLPFHPEQIRHFPPWSKDRLRLLLLQRLYSRSSARADAVVVPSRFAIGAMRPYAGDLSEKAFVAANPIPPYAHLDPARPPAHPNGGEPFLFYLSVVFWYKNHLELVEGFRRAVLIDPTVPDLVMAGVPAQAEYVRRVERAVADPALAGRARFLGKIPMEDIPGWLHHAAINLFPSTCETNSFIQGEILGMHGVMACSNVGPMPEVAGPAADLFDPRDPDSIARAIVDLWRNEARRKELRRLAAARAAEFTLEACGGAVWEAVRRAAASHASRRRRAA